MKDSAVLPEELENFVPADTEGKGESSLFHSGISQPQRISFIKYQLINAKVNHEYENRASLLSSYFSEIFERLSASEVKQCELYENNIALAGENSLYNDTQLLKFERLLNCLSRKYNLSSPDKIDESMKYYKKKL